MPRGRYTQTVVIRILSYVLVVAISFAGGYFYALQTQSIPVIAVSDIAPAPIVATTKKISEAAKAYSLDVEYPSFGIEKIDSTIEAKINETISEFKALPPNPGDMASPQNELTIRYELPYIDDKIISFKLITTEYTGGAHPNSIFSGLNFDPVSGRQYLQDDAFKMIGRSLQQVSISATAQLREKLGEAFSPDGANSNPENFSSFLLSKDKVTFIFQPYQVAAYAAGPQEVSFVRQR